MSKELFVSSTPHETKVAIVEDDQLTEVYYERENEYTLAGSIYKGRVTRVLPGMQSAFVNVGLERDAFLYVSDFLLEEEDDTEGLEQVVSRSRPEIYEVSAPLEHSEPIEAEEIIPPAEPHAGHVHADEEAEEPATAEASSEGDNDEDSEREGGARKWRGRRRRGRGRFQERFGDRGQNRFSERGEREAKPAHERETRPAEPAQENQPQPSYTPHTPARTEHREFTPARTEHRDFEPIILPGESLSKYQPQGAVPSQPKPEPPAQPVSQYRSKPSTEYSLDSAQFAPGSMVLPGESISKYRGNAQRRATVVTHEAAPAETAHTAVQEERLHSSAPATEREAEYPAEPHAVDEPLQQASYSVRHDLGYTAPAPVKEPEEEVGADEHHSESASADAPVATEEEPHHAAHGETRHVEEEEDRQRFESMNVASVFGGEAVETPEETEESEETEIVHLHPAEEPARAEESKPWMAAGSGVVEEEEIEEEESDLPAFEDHLDLADFEELEEEEMARDEQMVSMGSELTEAVRDAHVNEVATGQYEAEGLEEDEEEFEQATAADEDEDEDLEEAETEEVENGRVAVRSAGAYPQRSDRGRPDRRGRKFGRRMRGRPRHHVQRQLPAISDLLKEGQEILVQIAKEPIAKKGARITSHIALPGRYLVYMPTVHHTGVSRKIASEEERQRLKRIVLSERGDSNGGFIVRTAAAGANEDDLRADIRFLINLWNEIKGRAERSKAPALIYHDLNLVERILRDQVTVSFSSIWVDTEQEYERILRFVSRFQPSLVKRVKLYTKETPLFEQFSISDEINKALKSKVWLKSGGYIVINQTEALVAIDINTGKYVGKTARLEDTIVKTNIDAIKEIVRQIRLRDLGGIIVIDFIDMDERKNRQKVMQALEDALKADRAPSKVLQFNDFGLVAITRKRVKQSLERTLGQQCPICTGTGMIKSVSTVCNEVYVEMRKMARHFEHDVVLRVNPDVAKALKSNNARWLQEMEELTRRTILVKSDPLLHPEQFDIQ